MSASKCLDNYSFGGFSLEIQASHTLTFKHFINPFKAEIYSVQRSFENI